MKKYAIMFASVIAALLLLSLGIWYIFSKNPAYRFGTERSSVITQVQSLSRLETASYTLDKVIEASTGYGALRQFLFGDKILLIAHGEVIAGYDLSKMTSGDFSGSGKNITIHLPAPQVFSSTLDNSQTTVFDRTKGLFTKGELNLEAQARAEAEQAIRQAACEGGILDTAEKNGKVQLETIFRSAGFDQISFESKKGQQTSDCK